MNLSSKPNPTLSFSCEFIASLDIDISKVLDIGVQSQTLELKKSFTDKKHLLIEPQKSYNPLIASNYQGIDYTLENLACTNHNGEMYLHEEYLWDCKVPTHNHISTKKSKIKVKTKTLETICKQFKIKKWTLLKIDVDGEEINILNSGLNCLNNFCFIIIECVIERFTDINNILTNNGFTLFHINDICYIENMMSQFDAVYVNDDLKELNPKLRPSFQIDTWHKHVS